MLFKQPKSVMNEEEEDSFCSSIDDYEVFLEKMKNSPLQARE